MYSFDLCTIIKTYLEYQRFFGHKLVNFKAVVPVLLPTSDGISKENGVLKREKKKMKNWFLVQHPIMVMFSLLLSAVQAKILLYFWVQVILFDIDCAIFYTNSHELFCQFITWTNWVNLWTIAEYHVMLWLIWKIFMTIS